MTIRKYGWRPSLPDFRDHKFTRLVAPVKLPDSVDLRFYMPPVYDQGSLGSCSAQAIAAAIDYDIVKQDGKYITPSRLFIYYNERLIENSVDSDNGSTIRDGINAISKYGCCHENLWPYNVDVFTQQPSLECYADGTNFIAISYQNIDNTNANNIMSALAQGYPVVCGITVYDSFEGDYTAQTGIVQMPSLNENCLGGHSQLIVGYDTLSQMFISRNSWGPNWGMAGYSKIPFAYLTNPDLAADFWVISKIL